MYDDETHHAVGVAFLEALMRLHEDPETKRSFELVCREMLKCTSGDDGVRLQRAISDTNSRRDARR
jgi:hypothetical protein